MQIGRNAVYPGQPLRSLGLKAPAWSGPPSYREPSTVASLDLLDRSTSIEVARLKNHVAFPRSQPEQAVTLPELVASNQRAQKRYLQLLRASLTPTEIDSLQALLPQGGAPLYRKIAELRRGLAPEQARIGEILARLADRAGLLEVSLKFPRLTADGLTRTSIHTQSPLGMLTNMLTQNWEVDDRSKLPVADVVIVGAGPMGMATAYHLAEKGARTVVLEAGYAGQAFSDAGAPAVHEMRTAGQTSSLVNTGERWDDLYAEAGLPRHLGHYRTKAKEARESLDHYTGLKTPGEGKNEVFSENGVHEIDFRLPIGRGILYQHLSDMADRLAHEYPDTFLLENAAVNSIQKEGEFFQVTTAQGHRLLARKLVVATGIVGTDGQHGKSSSLMRSLSQQDPDKMLLLQEDRQLLEKASQMVDPKRLWAISDRLLGSPAIQQRLAQLEKESRVVVLGSGESASKAVREVHRQNPHVIIDWYTSEPVTPAQVQVPEQNFYYPILQTAPLDLRFGEESLSQYKKFGTPVTPATLHEVLTLESQGKVRIHEMGKHFDENSVEAEWKPDGLSFRLKDPEVLENLRSQRQEWIGRGLYAAGAEPPDCQAELPLCNGMVVMATGYSRASGQASPLAQQLADSGLLRLHTEGPRQGLPVFDPDHPLMSAADPNFAPAGSWALSTAADSALPGMAARGRLLAEQLAQSLPSRSPTPGPQTLVPSTFFSRSHDRWSQAPTEPFVEGGTVGLPIDAIGLPMSLWPQHKLIQGPAMELRRQALADDRMTYLAEEFIDFGRPKLPGFGSGTPVKGLMVDRWESHFTEGFQKPGDFLDQGALPQNTVRNFSAKERQLHYHRLLQTLQQPGETPQTETVLLQRLKDRTGDPSRTIAQRHFDASKCLEFGGEGLDWLEVAFADRYPAGLLREKQQEITDRGYLSPPAGVVLQFAEAHLEQS